MVTVINHLPLLDRIISTTNKDLVNRELPQEINIILGWGGGKKERNSYIWNIFIHKNVPGIFTNEGIGNRCLLFKFSHNELLFKFLLVRIQNFCPQFHILSYWYFFFNIHPFPLPLFIILLQIPKLIKIYSVSSQWDWIFFCLMKHYNSFDLSATCCCCC